MCVCVCVMDSRAIIEAFSCNSVQPPMSDGTQTPLHYRSCLHPSYLKVENPTEHCKEDDAEIISIFDAQKYFSESNDPKEIKRQLQQETDNDLISLPRLSSVSSVDGCGNNSRTGSIPTVISEGDWNSHAGLLANPPGSSTDSSRNLHSNDGNRRKSVAKRWFFRRRCCCNGEKAVQVKEVTAGSNHISSKTSHRVGRRLVWPVRKNDEYKPRNVLTTDLKDGALGMIPTTNDNASKSKFDNMYIKWDQDHKSKPQRSLSERCTIINAIPEINRDRAQVPNSSRLSPEKHFEFKLPSSFAAEIRSSSALRNLLHTSVPPIQQHVSASEKPITNGTVGFSFPILNTSTTETVIKPVPAKTTVIPLSPDSLEALQPMHELPLVSKPQSMDDQVNSAAHFNQRSPITRDYDMESDTSSELFEIESFSTQTTSIYPMYRGRDSLDEALTLNAVKLASSDAIDVISNEPPAEIPATECCTGSEDSIEWSFEEAYDSASFTNFSVSAGEVAFLRQRKKEEGSEKRKVNGLMIMSCRQEKAVSVGPQPVKRTSEATALPGRSPQGNKPALGRFHPDGGRI